MYTKTHLLFQIKCLLLKRGFHLKKKKYLKRRLGKLNKDTASVVGKASEGMVYLLANWGMGDSETRSRHYAEQAHDLLRLDQHLDDYDEIDLHPLRNQVSYNYIKLVLITFLTYKIEWFMLLLLQNHLISIRFFWYFLLQYHQKRKLNIFLRCVCGNVVIMHNRGHIFRYFLLFKIS